MPQQSLGLIETIGLVAAVEAADAAVKAANVELVGYEFAKGAGMTTVKFLGEVGAVKAAVAAGEMAASRVNRVVATNIIARPGLGLDALVGSVDTIGRPEEPVEAKPKPAPKPEPVKAAPVAEKPKPAPAKPAPAAAKPAPKPAVDAATKAAPAAPKKSVEVTPAKKTAPAKAATSTSPIKKPEHSGKTSTRQGRKPEPTS